MSDSDPIKLGNFSGSADADAILRELDNESPTAKRPGAKPPKQRSGAPSTNDGRRSRIAFWALAWILIACIAGQVFLAGLALFESSPNWTWHVDAGYALELVPVVMLVLSFIGHLRHSMKLLSAAMIVLFGLQYAFIEFGGKYHIIELKALHPVNALLIIWVAVIIARRANAVWSEERPAATT